MLLESDILRFNNKINIDINSNCWNWSAGKDKNGYGWFHYNNKTHFAHRISYKYFYDTNIEKLNVCHSCDNPSCVNPNHLWLGTNQDNLTDMVNKGRSIFGENHRDAKLTDKIVKQLLIDVWNYKYQNMHEIAIKFNISDTSIYQILNGKTWTHITNKLQVPLVDFKNCFTNNKGGNFRVSDDDVRKIRSIANQQHNLTKKQLYINLSKQFGISPSAIQKIVLRITYQRI